METIDKNAEHGHGNENNGCIGHPITNMLMGSTSESAAALAFVNGGCQPGDEEHSYAAEGLAGELQREVLDEMDAMFEELHGQVQTALDQVRATDERTAHLVIVAERLARGVADAHEKLDRILNHFKVA